MDASLTWNADSAGHITRVRNPQGYIETFARANAVRHTQLPVAEVGIGKRECKREEGSVISMVAAVSIGNVRAIKPSRQNFAVATIPCPIT